MAFHGLLVSSGFSSSVVREKVASLAAERRYTRAHIVTTARPEKEKAPWVSVTKEQLEEMGMEVSFVDFDADESLGDNVDLIYVCGGNTFHLLHSIQHILVSIQDQILAMCNRGGLYIGSSAGAVLVSPSIVSAGAVHPDKNMDSVTDLTGFHFISQHIIPHYNSSLDGEIVVFREKYNLSEDEVLLLRDGEGLYVDGEQQALVT